MTKKMLLALALATTGLAAPAMAQQATVNGTTLASGGMTTINFDGPTGSGATSSLQLTYDGITGGVATFDYIFGMTGNLAAANLTGFGFDTSPTLFGVTGTGLNFVLNPVNFPGGENVNACGFAGNNCDAANNQGDLFSGTFVLTFAPTTTDFTLNGFVDRYASITALNNTSGEGHPVGTPTPFSTAPEPATWAMMLLGFGGIGYSMRRSRRGRRRVLAQVA
jgi:hypothetical protein